MTQDTQQRADGPRTITRIRWGAVLAATVIGVALVVILATLWGALAYGTGVITVETNLAWFVGISAIAATFVGGLAAGWLSGVPGAGVGAVHGVTVWALILVASLLITIPGFVGTIGVVATVSGDTNAAGEALWAAFLAMVVGGLAAGVGGAIGGALSRSAAVVAPHTHDPRSRTGQTSTRPQSRGPVAEAAGPPRASESTTDARRGSGEGAYQPVPPEEEAQRVTDGRHDVWPYVESDLR